MKKMTLGMTLLTALTLSSQTSFAKNSATGKKLYKKINCAQCHGKDGSGKAKLKAGKWKLSGVKGPQIAGLDAKYVEEQLKAIRDKKRKTKYTTSMYVKIKKLSDDDLKGLAIYLSKDLNPKAKKIKGMNQQ